MKYEKIINSHPNLFNNNNAMLEIITDVDLIHNWVRDQKKQLVTESKPKEWGEIGVVYEGPYIVVLRDLVRFPNGQLGSYFRIVNTADLKGGQGVAVLPLIEDNILLLRIYRHAIRSWQWEIPRGFGEPNTSAEDNARKEVLEEVEGEIEELVDLGIFHNNSGAEANDIKLFYAKLSKVGQPNKEEGIENYKLVDISEFERMIRDAEITDGFTIGAFARARLRGLI